MLLLCSLNVRRFQTSLRVSLQLQLKSSKVFRDLSVKNITSTLDNRAILGDGRPFWKLVVSEATGCSDLNYFKHYYARGDSWRLPEGAYETMVLLKDAGVKLAVVSNFDLWLRKLLQELNVLHLFDAVIISSEVGSEKPDADIFKAALDQTQADAGKAVHVGDDEKTDKVGANAVGIDCWLWGKEVTFSNIQNRILISES